MDAIQEQERAVVIQPGDEGSDAFTNGGSGVFGREANINRSQLEATDEVERGRDQGGHAFAANRPPERHESRQRLFMHAGVPPSGPVRRESRMARRGNAETVPAWR